MKYTENIQLDKLPQHIGIIMDGNGRWAKKWGFLRNIGHENGVKTVKKIVKYCAQIGVPHLTLYAFSTENWNRPAIEVNALMKLMSFALKNEIKSFVENDIRFNVIGNIDDLPSEVSKELKKAMEVTKNGKRMTLSVALSYGSRDEITQVVKKIAQKVQNGELAIDAISEDTISQNLFTHDIPDVDLMIRTSGEQRISNFLLWQLAYSELYFTETLWPDFDEEGLAEAIYNFQNRERRFGKTSEQLTK